MLLRETDLSAALPLWPQLAGAVPVLINHSENQTFGVTTPTGDRFSLRVHRPNYQSPQTIQSELAWLTALRQDTDLPVPEAVAGRDGATLQRFDSVAGERHAVLFHHIAGQEPVPGENLTGLFGVLGNYAARMHLHAMSWQKPEGFERQVWNAGTILDVDGLWGDWRLAPGVDAAVRHVLDRVDAALWRRTSQYGTDNERYGLIHADMRLGNLLVDGDAVSLIDFDDCGFCWFVYDFAAAISFHETNPEIPVLKNAWLTAYQAVRPLSAEDRSAIDTMVMLRRMALLAWIGSHSETDLAQTHMDGFAAGTAELGERYLRGALWP